MHSRERWVSRVRRVSRTIAYLFLASVLLLCLMMQILPDENILASKRQSGSGNRGRSAGSIFPKWMFSYRRQLLAELDSHAKKPNVLLQWVLVVAKYSIFLLRILWKEVLLCFVVHHYFPQLKAMVYSYTPDWVDDLGVRVAATFSNDDMEPPPALEGDELLSLNGFKCDSRSTYNPLLPHHSRRGVLSSSSSSSSSGSSNRNRNAHSGNSLVGDDDSPIDSNSGSGSSSGGSSGGNRSPLQTQRSSPSPSKVVQFNGQEVDADEWYVFDPTYGVIPITCRDLWNKQGREAEVRREAAIDRGRGRVVPPVRFSASAEGGT